MRKVSIVFPVYKKTNVSRSIWKYWKVIREKYSAEIIIVIEGIDRNEYLKLEKELKFAKIKVTENRSHLSKLDRYTERTQRCSRGARNGVSVPSEQRSIEPSLEIIWNEKRMGKGWAVRNGLRASRGEIIGFVDADEAVSPEEVLRVVKLSEKYGILIGSRRPEQYKSKTRKLLSVVFNFYIRTLLGLEVKDSQCGIKFFRRKSIAPILDRMRINGFAFDAEILYILKENGEKITEEKIEWKDVGKSTVGFFSIIGMVIDILRIRFKF